MSSHREAPEISKDPVADNTDLYAFVSPDRPDTVTLISNYIPLEAPAGGPNFYEFGDDVLYEIHVANRGTARSDVTYQFRFRTEVRNPDSFLYNTGAITSLNSPTWNKRQFYSVTRVVDGHHTVLAHDLASPPCNVGPLSTPHYPALAKQALHNLGGGRKVFAGQRDEGFYVDLGSVFDLLDLRPIQTLHLDPFTSTNDPGVDGTAGFSVHSIAIQVPITDLTRDGSRPTDPSDPRAVIGVWATASRQRVSIRDDDDDDDDRGQSHSNVGPFSQVSRMANPLINEVIIPLGDKDRWNRLAPSHDAQFTHYVETPEVAGLLPVLYPGVFPNLAGLNASGVPRADLVAILMTGIPAGLIPGFVTFTGTTEADLLRLNTAIPPSKHPSIYGPLGGDFAGFPNGRRVADDVVAIELRVLAGLLYPLVDSSFTPDAAASTVDDGVTDQTDRRPYLDVFPYLGIPRSGYSTPPF